MQKIDSNKNIDYFSVIATTVVALAPVLKMYGFWIISFSEILMVCALGFMRDLIRRFLC